MEVIAGTAIDVFVTELPSRGAALMNIAIAMTRRVNRKRILMASL
jgi:hypothetical protein